MSEYHTANPSAGLGASPARKAQKRPVGRRAGAGREGRAASGGEKARLPCEAGACPRRREARHTRHLLRDARLSPSLFTPRTRAFAWRRSRAFAAFRGLRSPVFRAAYYEGGVDELCRIGAECPLRRLAGVCAGRGICYRGVQAAIISQVSDNAVGAREGACGPQGLEPRRGRGDPPVRGR